MGINEKLMRIQTEIKAPKNLYNSFGKYKYRNAEGICEAVKPYLTRENCNLTLSDEIVEVGGRIYVKATATLQDTESDCVFIQVSAMARESEVKKGMDESQITGTASSYARKYALNGLFLLDDTNDADTDEYKMQNDAKSEQEKDAEETAKIAKDKVSEVMWKALKVRCEKEGVSLYVICNLYKVKELAELTNAQYRNINDHWQQLLDRAKQ